MPSTSDSKRPLRDIAPAWPKIRQIVKLLNIMVYLFFATGTEELEALGTADIIRRAGLDLQIVSITGERIRDHAYLGRPVAAICAAPLVLGRLGLLEGKRATCYPGFEGELTGATCTGALVEQDGQIITGKGPAAVFEFGYTIVAHMKDQQTADALSHGMLYK